MTDTSLATTDDPSATAARVRRTLNGGADTSALMQIQMGRLRSEMGDPEIKLLHEKAAASAVTEAEKSPPDEMRRYVAPLPALAPPKREDYATNPWETLFSPGVALGILASGLSHQPWSTAMNAATAGINARNAGDTERYKEAFEAYKTNYDLALKRHTAQAEDFKEISQLYKDKPAQFDAAARQLAAEYDDPMLRHVLDDAIKMNELQLKRQTAGIAAQRAHDEHYATTHSLGYAEAQMRDAEKKYPPNSPEVQAAQSAYKEALQHFREAEEAKKGVRGTTPFAIAYQTEQSRREAAGEPPMTEQDIAKMQNYLKANQNLTPAERVKLQNRVDSLGNSMSVLGSDDKEDSALGILNKHVFAAGAPGKVTRTAEIVSNLFGSNETDRKQFERYIEQLRLTGSRLLLDANGRPLSAEAHRINDIIGGLSLGDTTANTIRSLNEIKTLYTKMRGQSMSQLSGTWKSEDEPGGAPAATTSPASQSWRDAPLVQ